MAVSNPLAQMMGKSPVRPIQEQMQKSVEAAQALPGFFKASQRGDWTRAREIQKEIVMHERHADKLKHAVRNHLPRRLFMPVSRNDLIDLVTTQDRIANLSKDIAGLMLGRKVRFPKTLKKQFQEYLEACVEVAAQARLAIDNLDEVFEVGFSRREIKHVDSMIKQISKLERRTDRLQIKLRTELFKIEAELPAVEVMFLYKLIDLIGDLADYSERTGNRLQILISH
jgi:predicted phosphate transport protein (TIGR00153 family)